MANPIGGKLEQKEIGLQVGINGTHVNTELNSDGFLVLKKTEEDANGAPVYAGSGSWTSAIIDLKGDFASFEKLFVKDNLAGESSYVTYTRTSGNRATWSEWAIVGEAGMIQSEPKQYMQIKIELAAGFVVDAYLISNFNNAGHVSLFTPNSFIETSNGLRLKRDYEFDMTVDTTWTGEGSLHRKNVTRDEWLRIDKININNK